MLESSIIMEINKAEKKYDKRKKYILDKLTSLYYNLEEIPNDVKQNISICSLDRTDKTNFMFILSEVINERVISFIFKDDKNSDDFYIGFFGLTESEMDQLDNSFQADPLFLSASRGSQNFNLYLQAICVLEIPAIQNINPKELYDKILYPSDEDVNFEDITIFFGDFYFLKINISLVNTTKWENEISRISSHVFIKSNILISLPFNDQIIYSMTELTKELNHINYYHLLECIVSPTWGDSFFKIYKIIESLYPIYYYRNLYSDIKPESKNIVYLSYLIEKNVDARPSEVTSIKNAFDFYDKNAKISQEMFEIFKINDSSVSSLANQIYGLRNSYVHGRWIFDPKNLEIISNNDSNNAQIGFSEINNKSTPIARPYRTLFKEEWQIIIDELLCMIIIFLNDAIKNDFIEKVLEIDSKSI